jgi:8-oxo-dGTP pyrophosphatase MutT (NUDIX family)
MQDEYHFIQRKILSDLLFGNQLKYSQLKPTDMEGSQFTFHINKLIDAGLVSKSDNQYILTAKGKNIANTFDIDSKNPGKQAKHSVVFCAFDRNDKTLIYTRKKNPFYNHQGYPTGKVMYGESILETAERELHEETGLSGKAKLIGIRHYRVYYPTRNNLVEDKVMYICRIDNPTGELVSNAEGEFEWINREKINETVTNPLPEFKEIFEMMSTFNGKITFAERKHYPKQF